MDLLSMSEEELFKMWADNPEDLKIIILESELKADGLARLFANNPSLEDTILSCVSNHYELYFTLDDAEDELLRERYATTNFKEETEEKKNIEKCREAKKRLLKSELFDDDIESLVDYVIANPHNSIKVMHFSNDLLQLYDRVDARRIPLHKVIDKKSEMRNTTIERLLEDLEETIQSQGYSSIAELRQEKAEKKAIELNALIDTVDNLIAQAGYTPDELRGICEGYGLNFDEIDRITLHEIYAKHGYDYDLTTDTRSADTCARLMIDADEELEAFYRENPEWDDRVFSPIPEGMSEEEFSDIMGTHINEFGEIIRPENIEVSDVPDRIAFMYRRIDTIETRLEELKALDYESAFLMDIDAEHEIAELTEELEDIKSELTAYEAKKRTPLQQREAELSAEEDKARKYSELEVLIAKQNLKQGEQK